MQRLLAALGLCLALALVAYATPLLSPGPRSANAPPPARAASTYPDSPLQQDGAPIRLSVDIAWLPPSVAQHEALLVEAGSHHQIDPELLAIVTLVESGGYPGARSPSGARGLMQIMPATGRAIAGERSLDDYQHDALYGPNYNIDFGAWYLAKQLRDFATGDAGDSVERAAAAYNGGPGRLRRHLEGDGGLSDETRRYRSWVRRMWEQRRTRRSTAYQQWYDAGGERLVARAMDAMEAAPRSSPP